MTSSAEYTASWPVACSSAALSVATSARTMAPEPSERREEGGREGRGGDEPSHQGPSSQAEDTGTTHSTQGGGGGARQRVSPARPHYTVCHSTGLSRPPAHTAPGYQLAVNRPHSRHSMQHRKSRTNSDPCTVLRVGGATGGAHAMRTGVVGAEPAQAGQPQSWASACLVPAVLAEHGHQIFGGLRVWCRQRLSCRLGLGLRLRLGLGLGR
eukprot:COSAG01_NODE_58_length_30193_cov_12.302020_33_plen_211_part_00